MKWNFSEPRCTNHQQLRKCRSAWKFLCCRKWKERPNPCWSPDRHVWPTL